MPDPLMLLGSSLGLLIIAVWLFWPDSGLLSRWRAIRRVTTRVLQEDAIKHVQKMTLGGRRATLQSVAGALEIDRDRACQILAGLEESGLLARDGETLTLTAEGRRTAVNIIRAHRVWEQYLAEKTGYRESEWHAQADHHEHTLTPAEVDELARSLGHPPLDPHGDPIPTKEGELHPYRGEPLTKLSVNQLARIAHVGDEPEAVAAQIRAEGLIPGMLVRLIESDARRVRFWADEEEHLLAPVVAARISVIPIAEEVVEDQPAGQPLSDLAVGQRGKVVALSPRCRGPERRRMMDMGVLPGTVIEPELVSPGGDPTAYRVRGALIALRADQAQHIRVETLHARETQPAG